MALGRRPEPIHGLRDDVDRGVESEREIGDHQVVVDRLGDADHGDAEVVVEPERDAQGIVSADHDEGVQLEPGEVLAEGDQVGFRVPIGIGAGRAEDAPALCDDAVGLGGRERAGHVLDQAPPALQDADASRRLLGELLDNGADDGVQVPGNHRRP